VSPLVAASLVQRDCGSIRWAQLSIRAGEIDRLVAIVPPDPVVLVVLVSEYFEHVAVAAPRVEFGGLDDDVVARLGVHHRLLSCVRVQRPADWPCRQHLAGVVGAVDDTGLRQVQEDATTARTSTLWDSELGLWR
jgi:hypothetical protein